MGCPHPGHWCLRGNNNFINLFVVVSNNKGSHSSDLNDLFTFLEMSSGIIRARLTPKRINLDCIQIEMLFCLLK